MIIFCIKRGSRAFDALVYLTYLFKKLLFITYFFHLLFLKNINFLLAGSLKALNYGSPTNGLEALSTRLDDENSWARIQSYQIVRSFSFFFSNFEFCWVNRLGSLKKKPSYGILPLLLEAISLLLIINSHRKSYYVVPSIGIVMKLTAIIRRN